MTSLSETTRIRRPRRTHGFSLIELLATIMVLGIMTSIAITMAGHNAWRAAQEGVHKRNAQALAALCMCAQAGGANPIVPDDKTATVQNLINGVTAPAMGTLKPMVYRMDLTAGESVDGAMGYLALQGDGLIYVEGPTP
jgi:prepilin-type N-terminal cleavage/methylation domain-containing protein